jgi:hypothetical protein
MLLPSALARATIELLPRSRYANALQATIVRQSDPTIALDRHRTIYGDDDLADVDGRRVAEIAIFLLDAIDRTAAYFTGTAAGLEPDVEPPVPRVWSPPPDVPISDRAVARLDAIAELPRRLVARATRRPPLPPLERLGAALAAIPEVDRDRVVRVDASREEPLAALAALVPDETSVVVVTVDADAGRPSRAIVDRLEELGLRPHVFDGGRLVAGRPGGTLSTPLVGIAPRLAAEIRNLASA